MTKETFNTIVKNTKSIRKDFDSFSELKLDIFELDFVDKFWANQEALLKDLLTEIQFDYFDWWMYENNCGNGLWNCGEPARFKYKEKVLYTGKDLDKVYETLIGLK